jgi:hypothetical protein
VTPGITGEYTGGSGNNISNYTTIICLMRIDRMQEIRLQSTLSRRYLKCLSQPREISAPVCSTIVPPISTCQLRMENSRLERDRHTRARCETPACPPRFSTATIHISRVACGVVSCVEVGVHGVDPEQSQVFVPDGLKVRRVGGLEALGKLSDVGAREGGCGIGEKGFRGSARGEMGGWRRRRCLY